MSKPLDDYCYEDFEIGPYFCVANGDGDEIILTVNEGDWQKLRKIYPPGTTLETIIMETADWALTNFAKWTEQANALKGIRK